MAKSLPKKCLFFLLGMSENLFLPPSAKGVGTQPAHSLGYKKKWLCQFQREDPKHGSGECFCHAGLSQYQYNLLQPAKMPKYKSKPQKLEFP